MTSEQKVTPFAYRKDTPRLHGPAGYNEHSSYRPWLRDEFSFRCVFCLLRERWGRVTGEFDVDHFVPQQVDGSRRLTYENLLYACHACNLKKGTLALPNVEHVLTADNVDLRLDGRLKGKTADSERLIAIMTLNSPRWVQWRLSWMRIIELARMRDQQLFEQLMGYPGDLPDLSVLKPPHNELPEGIEQSHFARRERGMLATTY